MKGRHFVTSFREQLQRWVYSPPVQGFIIVCITVNAIQLGLDTCRGWNAVAGSFSRMLDTIFLWIFTIEVLSKIIADGPRFFKSGWNSFDFLVVSISLIPGGGIFSVLRSFRIFRTFRLLYRLPGLRIITESLLISISSIGWISLLLLIFFYIVSVIATNLFGKAFPQWFGTIGESIYSLFQIMTLESWSMGIVRPVMERYPHAWLLFVPFILIATYTVLNLFVGVMVNAISEAKTAKECGKEDTFGQKNAELNQEILGEVRALRRELDSLRRKINADNTECRNIEEVRNHGSH